MYDKLLGMYRPNDIMPYAPLRLKSQHLQSIIIKAESVLIHGQYRKRRGHSWIAMSIFQTKRKYGKADSSMAYISNTFLPPLNWNEDDEPYAYAHTDRDPKAKKAKENISKKNSQREGKVASRSAGTAKRRPALATIASENVIKAHQSGDQGRYKGKYFNSC
jgi:hypothetical protein